MIINFLIVGQGIAGTTLAHQLEKHGQSFLIIDNNPSISSSKIASGLWNPVVLKRMKKVWRADDMLNVLDDYYNYVEDKLNVSIIENKKIQRIFFSKEEQNRWYEHCDNPAFGDILNPQIINNNSKEKK